MILPLASRLWLNLASLGPSQYEKNADEQPHWYLSSTQAAQVPRQSGQSRTREKELADFVENAVSLTGGSGRDNSVGEQRPRCNSSGTRPWTILATTLPSSMPTRL